MFRKSKTRVGSLAIDYWRKASSRNYLITVPYQVLVVENVPTMEQATSIRLKRVTEKNSFERFQCNIIVQQQFFNRTWTRQARFREW